MRSQKPTGSLFDAVRLLQHFVCAIEEGRRHSPSLSRALPHLDNPADRAILEGLLFRLAWKLDTRQDALSMIKRAGLVQAVETLGRRRLSPTASEFHLHTRETGHETLADIAADRGYSGDTLRRRITRRTGASPRNVRRRERMAHAVDLLREGMKVVAVARECGYRSERSFFAAFRELTGQTPAAVRTLTAAQVDELKKILLPWREARHRPARVP